ncbi:MAG: XTP/dITP diphosphohydrolase [Patiriisocius sp.]|jgi:XTP/dITP diphosphohydrolase
MDKIVLATGNKGKVAEFSHLFKQYQIKVLPQSDFQVPDVPETGTTFVENAIIKARHAAKLTGLPAIADDSGLVVDALNGAPGIYSARYAAQENGGNPSDIDNCTKLLKALNGNPDRKAKFLCVLVFMRNANDPTPIICQGEWRGEIATTPFGDGGFGYDPIFYVPCLKHTAAELSKHEKSEISHRAKALIKLMHKLQALI